MPHERSVTLEETISITQKFATHRKLRKILIIFWTWNILFGPIHNIFQAKLLQFGYSKEALTTLNTFAIPLFIALMPIVGKLCVGGNELHLASITWMFRFLCSFYLFGVLTQFSEISPDTRMVLVFLGLFVSGLTYNAFSASLMSYAARVGRETYGGPFLSTLSASMAVGRFLSDFIAFSMADYLDWKLTAAASIVLSLLYSRFLLPKLQNLGKKPSTIYLEERIKIT